MGSLVRPDLIFRSGSRLCKILVIPHRCDSSRFAMNAGVADRPPDAPIIADKITQLQEASTRSVEDTVVNTSLEAIYQHADQILNPITSLITSIPVEHMWVPVVATAAIFRALYLLTSRIWVYHKMQAVLPHSKWLSDINARKWVCINQGDMNALTKLKKETADYKADHNIKFPEINMLKTFTMIKGAVVGGVIFSSLLGTTYLAPEILSKATFYWCPSLLQSDPLYALPLINSVLCYLLFRVDSAIRISNSSDTSLIAKLKEKPIASSVVVLLTSGLLLNTTMSICDHIPTLFLVYWISSNTTALCVHLLITKSNTFRWCVGLMPHQQFTSAVASSTFTLSEMDQTVVRHRKEYERENENKRESKRESETSNT